MPDFEARFAAAYRAYLDEARTEVDAAAVACAVARSRRGLLPELGWPWAVRPAPAILWLITLGILLGLLGMALLAVGMRPQEPAAFRCPAGTNPNAPGPADQARPPLALTAPTAFDRRAGRMVVLAPIYGQSGPQTWTFDVCTNTWTRMYPAKEPSVNAVALVYDVDSDLTIAFGATGPFAYDLEANSWTGIPWTPASMSHQAERAVYDSATGLVVVSARNGLRESEWWTYDVDVDAWARIPVPVEPEPVGPATAYELITYDSAVDRVVAYDYKMPPDIWGPADIGTRLLDVRAALWSQSAASTPDFGFPWPGAMAYDESLHKSVVISTGLVIAYDAATDHWGVVVEEPDPIGCDVPTCVVAYDSVNERLVVFGGYYTIETTEPDGGVGTTRSSTDHVLAFDLHTRAWQTLLPATVQPTAVPTASSEP